MGMSSCRVGQLRRSPWKQSDRSDMYGQEMLELKVQILCRSKLYKSDSFLRAVHTLGWGGSGGQCVVVGC